LLLALTIWAIFQMKFSHWRIWKQIVFYSRQTWSGASSFPLSPMIYKHHAEVQ
jgi:hypothetical protein